MRRSERVDPATKERLLQRRLKAEAEKKALAKSLAMALDEEEEEEKEEKDSVLISRRNSNEKKRKRSAIGNNEDNDEEEEEIEKVEDDDICGSRKFIWLNEPIRQTESGTRYFSAFSRQKHTS